MAAMTGREGLDKLLQQKEQVFGLEVGKACIDRIELHESDVSSSLRELSAGAPCPVMSTQRDVVMKQLANGGRHAAVLGPVLQLVRLAQQGHGGLPEVLADVRGDFLSRVKDDRPGGTAQAEFSRRPTCRVAFRRLPIDPGALARRGPRAFLAIAEARPLDLGRGVANVTCGQRRRSG